MEIGDFLLDLGGEWGFGLGSYDLRVVRGFWLDTIVSPVTISKSLDRLFDLGLLNAKWDKIDESRWGRVYDITGEGSGLAKKIYGFVKDELPNIE